MLLLRRISSRRLVLAVVTLAVCLFLVHEHWIDLRTLDLDFVPHHDEPSDEPSIALSRHPVVVLHKRAERQFEALVRRQSKTAAAAEAEYTRRYGRQPPPGFRQWADYALEHGSPIIDDFDTIADGVHRYFNLTSAEVERRMRGAVAGLQDRIRVERCTFANGKFNEGCRHFGGPLADLLGGARQLAPDVDFLINFLDEPSVLLAPAEADDTQVQAPRWEDLSHRPIHDDVITACRVRGSPFLKPQGHLNTYGLPFVEDVAVAKDVCRNPYPNLQHGFLMCPATMFRMMDDVPILSQAAPYPFADILYPSTHYGLKSSLYKQTHDRAWSRKKNAAYWTGSSTGGHWSSDNWRNGHRQRIATLALDKRVNIRYLERLHAMEDGSFDFHTEPSPRLSDPRLFNVALTKIVGCADERVCNEQKRFFGLPRPLDSELEAFRYRYVIDIDGNSYSGRFYRFLASRSVPLKVSIFREWHDDRLVPWLHYVPISLSMDELPEVVRFLATTAEGQRISRRIAEAGREWYFKALTPVHQGIYLYRLMLELAWMQNPSRPS
jgi:hypothetical protein